MPHVALWLLVTLPLAVGQGDSLRLKTLDNCAYVGSYHTTEAATTLEWSHNGTRLEVRLSSSAIRAGYALRDGFVGIGFKGDGDQDPVGRDNLLLGWPQIDVTCVKDLFLNVTSFGWRGMCEQDNATLAIPNCTYARENNLNGTCRADNATIPELCSCLCNSEDGCWAPEPSCPDCRDGCSGCREGFGGYNCRIPVETDVYEPDGANTRIRLTFSRDLVNYGHTIVGGTPMQVDVVWAYYHTSLFHPTEPRCQEHVMSNLYLESPYLMVNRDMERSAMQIDFTSTDWARLEDGTCRDIPIQHVSGRPILHTQPGTGASSFSSGWVENLLKLGGGYEERIYVRHGATIDDFELLTEGSITPEPGDEVNVAEGSKHPLVWTAMNEESGVWANTSSPFDAAQYWALALYAPRDLSTIATYQHVESLRVWLDGFPILTDSEPALQDRSAPAVTFATGWHQLVIKLYNPANSSRMQIKFDTGGDLLYKLSLQTPGDGTALGADWITDFLFLGSESGDYVASTGLEENVINANATEADLHPKAGDVVTVPNATTVPLTWAVATQSGGQWGFGSFDHFVQYFSLAVYSTRDHSTYLTYRNDDAVRGWVDGQLVMSADVWDQNSDQHSQPFNLTQGWHQLLFKLYDGAGGSHFRVKVASTSFLRWDYSIPFSCEPNPCHNGGTCINSVCHCLDGFNGPLCDTGYLWGEQFQNMRMLLLFME